MSARFPRITAREPGPAGVGGPEATATTHRLQLLGGAYLLFAGLFELVLATLSQQSVRLSTLAAVRGAGASLAPPDLARIVDLSVGLGVAVAIAMSLVYVLLGLLTVAIRPPWLFYADLAVLGLVGLGVPVILAGLASGSAGPPGFWVPNLVLSLLALGLFAWFLYARLQVGPWACRAPA